MHELLTAETRIKRKDATGRRKTRHLSVRLSWEDHKHERERSSSTPPRSLGNPEVFLQPRRTCLQVSTTFQATWDFFFAISQGLRHSISQSPTSQATWVCQCLRMNFLQSVFCAKTIYTILLYVAFSCLLLTRKTLHWVSATWTANGKPV